MKYIVLSIIVLISVVAQSQTEIPVKTDGTQYIIKVYDGKTNEKLLYNNASISNWRYRLRVTSDLTGDGSQLWSFSTNDNDDFKDYINIFNHDKTLTENHFLMSYNWLAYLGANGPPSKQKEMQFKFVEVEDGWYKIETIEKPTDGSLSKVNYTPGADALSISDQGVAGFGEYKSLEINKDDMVNKVFKFEEFDPVKTLMSVIETGQVLYDSRSTASEADLYTFFLALERGRELAVFGTIAEVLEYLKVMKDAIEVFESVPFVESTVLLSNADFENDLINWNISSTKPDAVSITNDGIEGSKSISLNSNAEYKLKAFQSINNIPNGTYNVSCFARVSQDNTMALYAKSGSNSSVLPLEQENYLKKSQIVIEVTDGSLEFGIKGNTNDNLIPADNWGVFDDISLKYLEEFTVDIMNADFENDLTAWTNNSADKAAYISKKGVNGSNCLTFWRNVDYFARVSQTLNGLEKGKYILNAMIQNTSKDFSMFRIVDGVTTTLDLPAYGQLTKVGMPFDFEGGDVEIGFKGVLETDSVPKGMWLRVDDVKLVKSGFYPNYVTVSPTMQEEKIEAEVVEDYESEDLWLKVFQQGNNLQIQSNKNIVKASVYTITGNMVAIIQPNSKTAEVGLNKGVYIVQNVTEEGVVTTQKVIIR